MQIALYQPDMPMNVGGIARTAACFQTPLHIIEPCGFPFSPAALRRSALDYLEAAEIVRHADWETFVRSEPGRIVLLTTRASMAHTAFRFAPGDVLLLGRESAGVPNFVHDRADARVRIPIAPGMRSLNIGVAAAIALAEAHRQLGLFPS